MVCFDCRCLSRELSVWVQLGGCGGVGARMPVPKADLPEGYGRDAYPGVWVDTLKCKSKVACHSVLWVSEPTLLQTCGAHGAACAVVSPGQLREPLASQLAGGA